MKSREPLSQEGYELMGAAFEVHREQGGGLAEEIYQESFEMELGLRGIPFKAKAELVTYYKGQMLRKRYVPDLLVFESIIAELKSVAKLAPEHEAQIMNYMRLTKMPVGYLINFGPLEEVEWKRFILSEFLVEGDR